MTSDGLRHVVGRTPLVRVHSGGTEYWAKLEAAAPGGMKARAAVAMLDAAAARGELLPGAPVVESTSGTLGVGLTLVARSLGHPVILVVDDELEPDTRTLLRAYGARLEVVTRPDPAGGWQRARLNRLTEILSGTPGAYWPRQYDNPDNADGYAGMAREILDELGGADILVATVGSGGHCAGLTRVLRGHRPAVRVIGVDAVGSRIFGQPDRPRVMRGLGSSILPRNVAYPDYDEVHWVGAAEAVASCRRLAMDSGIAGGWSTGAAALVARWAAHREPGARVVTVFPDGPHRYLRTIYDDDWCQARNLLAPPAAQPAELTHPTAAEAHGWARCTVVRDPAEVPCTP